MSLDRVVQRIRLCVQFRPMYMELVGNQCALDGQWDLRIVDDEQDPPCLVDISRDKHLVLVRLEERLPLYVQGNHAVFQGEDLPLRVADNIVQPSRCVRVEICNIHDTGPHTLPKGCLVGLDLS